MPIAARAVFGPLESVFALSLADMRYDVLVCLLGKEGLAGNSTGMYAMILAWAVVYYCSLERFHS